MTPVRTFWPEGIRKECRALGSVIRSSLQASLETAKNERGTSLLEVLVVLLIASLLMAMAVPNLDELERPLVNGAHQVVGIVKLARAKAVSTTSAYILAPVSGERIGASTALSCDDPVPLADDSLFLDLPRGITLADTDWTVCLNSRGFAQQNVTIVLVDSELNGRSVEVFLGGAVRVVP